MRLSEIEIESITRLAGLHFGTDVQVFLFGSRASNLQRGGDIDLFISKKDSGHLTVRTKINFIIDLMLEIGEQKIDVVLDNSLQKNSAFFKTINQTGVRLC